MSQEIRQTELQDKTQQLLHGPLKHIRAAALAAALLPLASVAAAPVLTLWRGISARRGDHRHPTPREQPGTGTPGYWKNHAEAWPVTGITVGGVTYTKAEAIALLGKVGKDKTTTMFSSLVPANAERDDWQRWQLRERRPLPRPTPGWPPMDPWQQRGCSSHAWRSANRCTSVGQLQQRPNRALLHRIASRTTVPDGSSRVIGLPPSRAPSSYAC